MPSTESSCIKENNFQKWEMKCGRKVEFGITSSHFIFEIPTFLECIVFFFVNVNKNHFNSMLIYSFPLCFCVFFILWPEDEKKIRISFHFELRLHFTLGTLTQMRQRYTEESMIALVMVKLPFRLSYIHG